MTWQSLLSNASLEAYLTAPILFGLSTASPLQRAFCRIADGTPLGSLNTPELVEAVGNVTPIAGTKPRELILLSGIRTGKSILAACLAVHASQHCSVVGLQAGEIPRVSIVSLQKDLADVVFRHLSGFVHASPILRQLVMAERTDTLVLRHPTGRKIEIKVVAGSRTGASLVARWSAGVIFDEAPRMLGGDEAVINLDDARAAVRARLLPGAQMFSLGSPWAPFGPIYDLDNTHFQRPTAEMVVFKAPAYRMNPVVWTPEKCEALRVSDPDVYVTDVLGRYRQAESGLFGSELDASIHDGPLVTPADSRLDYVAAIDPATRSNGWTLVIQTLERGVRKVVLAKEWRGSKTEPLKPIDVFAEIAKLVQPYRVTQILSDSYGRDFIQAAAHESRLYIYQVSMTQKEQAEVYLRMQSDMLHGKLQIPNDPVLISDLRHLTKKTTQAGLAIHLPLTADGRHADFAPALMLCHRAFLEDRMHQADVIKLDMSPAALGKREEEKLIRHLQNPPKRMRGGLRYR